MFKFPNASECLTAMDTLMRDMAKICDRHLAGGPYLILGVADAKKGIISQSLPVPDPDHVLNAPFAEKRDMFRKFGHIIAELEFPVVYIILATEAGMKLMSAEEEAERVTSPKPVSAYPDKQEIFLLSGLTIYHGTRIRLFIMERDASGRARIARERTLPDEEVSDQQNFLLAAMFQGMAEAIQETPREAPPDAH